MMTRQYWHHSGLPLDLTLRPSGSRGSFFVVVASNSIGLKWIVLGQKDCQSIIG